MTAMSCGRSTHRRHFWKLLPDVVVDSLNNAAERNRLRHCVLPEVPSEDWTAQSGRFRPALRRDAEGPELGKQDREITRLQCRPLSSP